MMIISFFILALFTFQPQYKFNNSEVFDLFDRIDSKRNNARENMYREKEKKHMFFV
jgi:hypothetical protein